MSNNPLFEELANVINTDLVEAGNSKLWNDSVAAEYHKLKPSEIFKSDYFLNIGDTLYPFFFDLADELHAERQNRKIDLVVFNMGIGSGKTYFSSALEYYEWLYFTTTPNKKQAFPGIDPETSTAFILMSRDKEKAKKIVFTNVYRHFNCQFNKDYFPPNPRVRTYLDIPRNKTLIFPGTGEAVSALGFNLFSGIVDEAAFLQAVAKGSSSEEVTDPAQAMFEQINGRIDSRFGKNGGLIIMITSANKEGNFVENMIEKAIQDGNYKHKIFWRRAPVWKTKPPGFYPSGEVFLFNRDTYEIITDLDMIREYMDARSRLDLNTDFNPILGGLLL